MQIRDLALEELNKHPLLLHVNELELRVIKRRVLDGQAVYSVATAEDGEIIGWSGLDRSLSIGVREGFRRQGVGTELVRHAQKLREEITAIVSPEGGVRAKNLLENNFLASQGPTSRGRTLSDIKFDLGTFPCYYHPYINDKTAWGGSQPSSPSKCDSFWRGRWSGHPPEAD